MCGGPALHRTGVGAGFHSDGCASGADVCPFKEPQQNQNSVSPAACAKGVLRITGGSDTVPPSRLEDT